MIHDGIKQHDDYEEFYGFRPLIEIRLSPHIPRGVVIYSRTLLDGTKEPVAGRGINEPPPSIPWDTIHYSTADRPHADMIVQTTRTKMAKDRSHLRVVK